jgi:NAD(P)-dependent dehydrogenase (short-subunit alcohol dehydrogenase family)
MDGCLVAGVSRGLGLAMAQALAEAGLQTDYLKPSSSELVKKTAVIPGRRVAANPESIITGLGLWIPALGLWPRPE